MVLTINEIKERVIPIVKEYEVDSFSLFGSYAKGQADEESDLDFIMDDGKLKGLIQYFSLINRLEEEFHCHVDLISKKGTNKKFLESIKNEEVVLYER